MVSTGGETTNALLSIMESVGLDMVGEVQPGIPLSVTLGPVTFPIITKAGAFGSAKSLVSCYDALERMRRLSAHGATQVKNNACALQNHRSEERSVGKECGSKCSFRWSPCHTKKNKDIIRSTYTNM